MVLTVYENIKIAENIYFFIVFIGNVLVKESYGSIYKYYIWHYWVIFYATSRSWFSTD